MEAVEQGTVLKGDRERRERTPMLGVSPCVMIPQISEDGGISHVAADCSTVIHMGRSLMDPDYRASGEKSLR